MSYTKHLSYRPTVTAPPLPMNPAVGGRFAGHVAEVSTPDVHRLMLQNVKDYGANFRTRLIWRHIVVVTEVGLQHEHHRLPTHWIMSADVLSFCSSDKSALAGIMRRTVCISVRRHF